MKGTQPRQLISLVSSIILWGEWSSSPKRFNENHSWFVAICKTIKQVGRCWVEFYVYLPSLAQCLASCNLINSVYLTEVNSCLAISEQV